ncbi:MAG: APC family permease [Acidiferrobacterales bacterium]|nr:APC family permease [Acidiferrobacterales bacterium]
MDSTKPTHKLGVLALVTLVVGNAIGAGIYTTSGFALADLGAREWVLLAWLVAGFIALMGAVSYGMLVQDLTESGGEYLYLSRSIHPLAGFIAGWVSLLAGFPGAIAFAASAFESYLRSAINLDLIPHDFFAIGIIVFAGVIHSVRTKTGAKTHEVTTVLMMIVLALIIVWSLWQFVRLPNMPVVSEITKPFSWLAFANSLVWISLSYSGFNAAAYVAGEVNKPKVTVKRGMVIGTLITIFLCVTINAIILYSVPAELIEGKANIAAISANHLAGPVGQRAMELIISLSLLTSITAMVLAGPRVYAKMAQDGALPSCFKANEGTPPRSSIALQVFTAVILVMITNLTGLLSYLGLTLSLCLALAVSSLFVRHWRLGERPISAWYPIAPLIFVVATLLFAALSAISEPIKLLALLPTLILGTLAYWLSEPRRLD